MWALALQHTMVIIFASRCTPKGITPTERVLFSMFAIPKGPAIMSYAYYSRPSLKAYMKDVLWAPRLILNSPLFYA